MGSLAPTHNIPNEIIQEIFSHFAPPTVLNTHSSRRFPWVLGQICSKWRAIFHSMIHQFWSRICVRYEVSHFDSQKVRRIGEMVKFFVDRNRAKTISFEYMVLAMTVAASHSFPSAMHPVLEWLVEESMRWESVTIMVARQDLPILRRIRNRLPMLRKLVVSMHEPGLLPIASNDMFDNTPLLQDVMLTEASWKLKWTSLTKVDLRAAEKDMLAILPHILNVESLSITFIHNRSETTHSVYRPITLPHLKTLTVHHAASSFLDVFDGPELEALTLDCDIGYTKINTAPPGVTSSLGNSCTPITSFLSRSSCSIHHLTLKAIDGVSLSNILRYTPKLLSLKLTLRHKWRGSRSLACLCVPGHPDDLRDASRMLLARHLESLTIVAYPSGGHTDDPFLQEEINMLIHIIRSRTIAVEGSARERLRKLTVNMPSNTEFPTQLNGLKSLCAEVGVSFRYSFGA